MYKTLSEIISVCEKSGKPLWLVTAEEEAAEQAKTTDEIFEEMRKMYSAMKYTLENYDPDLRSRSGMTGTAGAAYEKFAAENKSLVGEYLDMVIAAAIKTAESNACMKRIVAAPTAGSCGVLPAVLISYEKFKSADEDNMVKALFVAGCIGEIIAKNASLSGAQGGCQAEIGSAAAMAAAALAFLEGGDNECIASAAALTMKNMLGLTCDPVAGLVEVPCVKRNVSGAVNAVSYAQLSLAGIRSVIPADEVIDSMRRIGRLLPECLRETGMDGLAVTPTACEISERLK
ncbi:MAG: L-serine ammonia-lyase, iron-sulfur-dependent, subunit alpha [Clostridia bacterium]|nr:L-serine ammonia-lyase, iron-sulfur-dependent, subunit alpha [Clostridia bacterium]